MDAEPGPESPSDATPADAEGAGRFIAPRRRVPDGATVLREAWQRNAERWITWARAPMHDSFWRFHRDQFLDLLPGPGALTLDIGGGEGRLSRELAARGHRMITLDVSLTQAGAAMTADPGSRVVVADAAGLPLRDDAADLAIAFMSFQDVDDMPRAVLEAARVLGPGGRLCLAIVHPLNSAGRFEDDADGPFVIADSYLGRRAYADEIMRAGLSMEFVSEHRPLQDYVAACRDAGLLIEDIREPAMPDHAVIAPRHRRWQRVPLFLHLRALRP